jgi:hypothetical protein
MGSIGFIPSMIEEGFRKKSHLKLTMATLNGIVVEEQISLLNCKVAVALSMKKCCEF